MKIVFQCVTATAVAASGIALFGSGMAAAQDPLIGKTYADAAAIVQDRWNRTPVVASAVGNELPRDECIVTSWVRPTTTDLMGGSGARTVQLNLNCGAKVALPGNPGNSVTSPEGQKEQKARQTAATIKKKPAICENNPEGCANFCNRNAEICKEFELPY